MWIFGGDLFPGPGCLAEAISFKFLRPVFFGDTVHTIAIITEVDKKQKRLTFSMTCYNENGEAVCEGEAICIPYQIEVSD